MKPNPTLGGSSNTHILFLAIGLCPSIFSISIMNDSIASNLIHDIENSSELSSVLLVFRTFFVMCYSFGGKLNLQCKYYKSIAFEIKELTSIGPVFAIFTARAELFLQRL